MNNAHEYPGEQLLFHTVRTPHFRFGRLDLRRILHGDPMRVVARVFQLHQFGAHLGAREAAIVLLGRRNGRDGQDGRSEYGKQTIFYGIDFQINEGG